MALMVPTIFVALPLLLLVAWLVYCMVELVASYLHPKVMGYIIRRYEKKTGLKWNPNEERFQER